MPSPTKAFCIKVGTTVTFKSGLRNTGFVIDFGTENPFDHEGSIIGGSDRPIIVTAKHPGCFTYTVGACTPGTVTACTAMLTPSSSFPPINLTTDSSDMSLEQNAHQPSASVSYFLSKLRDNAMPDTATRATLNDSVGAGERLRAWCCFRENLLGGGRKIVHVAEKCHRLPNLLHS